MSTEIVITTMHTKDLDFVHNIETQCNITPWSITQFTQSIGTTCVSKILKSQHVIIGFYVIDFIVDECHILNLGITPSQQGKQYAHVIMNDVFTEITRYNHSIHHLYLEVRNSNQKAQHLYQKWGLHALYERKNYYRTPPKGYESAWVYYRSLRQKNQQGLSQA